MLHKNDYLQRLVKQALEGQGYLDIRGQRFELTPEDKGYAAIRIDPAKDGGQRRLTVDAAGTQFFQRGDTGTRDFHSFEIENADVTWRGGFFTQADASASEQAHVFNLGKHACFDVEGSTFRSLIGDAVKVTGHMEGPPTELYMRHCRVSEGERNGVTWQRNTTGAIMGCHFSRLNDAAIDWEPSGPKADPSRDILIANNFIGPSRTENPYAITIAGIKRAGGAYDKRTRRVVLSGNILHGGLNLIWAGQVQMHGGIIQLPEDHKTGRAILINGAADDLTFDGVEIYGAKEGLHALAGHGIPKGIRLRNCTIAARNRAVFCQSAEDVSIRNCRIESDGPGDTAIQIATEKPEAASRFLIADNMLAGYEQGIRLVGGKAPLRDARVLRNETCDVPVPLMVKGTVELTEYDNDWQRAGAQGALL